MCWVVNEKNYWLIEMNNRKTLQALVFGFIVLNLVEKSVLRFFLKYAELYKTRSTKQITDNFQQRQPSKNRTNTKNISFQFHYLKFNQQSYSTLFYYYRHVSKGRSCGRSLLPFLENWKKVPWFWEKALLISWFACNTRMIVDANSSPPVSHVKKL